MGVVLTEEQIEDILEGGGEVLHRFVTPDGTVVFDSPAHIVATKKE